MNMINVSDYQEAAKRKLPRFLYDYIEGGAFGEHTLRANIEDLQSVKLRQRILRNTANLTLDTELFGQKYALPIALAPVGITGLFARRGECQAARAALNKEIPFCLSTFSICSLEEVCKQSSQPIWFQLYVFKDREIMRNLLDRAQACGVKNLLLTVDVPVHGVRYRDLHSGASGPFAAQRRLLQALTKPSWAFDVGVMGRPHTLGNVSPYFGTLGLESLVNQLDAELSWDDVKWIRNYWKGSFILKGILDLEDATIAASHGVDGIIISNHGGRQLDGVLSTATALPKIAEKLGDKLTLLVDSGVRSGLDVVRMLALGAKAVLLGRAAVYALAAQGQDGVENVLSIFENEMRVAMTLSGVSTISQIDKSILV